MTDAPSPQEVLPAPEPDGANARPDRAVLRRALPYAATAALALALVYVVLGLGGADLRYPLVPIISDYLFGAMVTKSVAVNGWYLTVPQLGAPHGLELYDFPLGDTLHLTAYSVLSLFTKNVALVINLYYLLGFVLIGLTSLFTFRRLRLPLLPSMSAAMLFAFLPHHLQRSEHHAFLSAYYLLPLMCLVLIWAARGTPFLRSVRTGRIPYRLTSEGSLALGVCALMGAGGVYYATFGIFLLLWAGLCSCVRARRWS